MKASVKYVGHTITHTGATPPQPKGVNISVPKDQSETGAKGGSGKGEGKC